MVNKIIIMQIYKITNLVNNKIYIGKDTTSDPNYFGSGLIISRSLKKYGMENFIKEIIDETDDFGDKTFSLQTFSENGVGPSKTFPNGDSLQLMGVCLGKDSTTDGKFYIVVSVLEGTTDPQVIGSVKSADIKFDGGNPTNIPVYVRGSRVVHLENASKYISKILNASTFSVKFETGEELTYRGTFNVQGFSKYLSNFKSAGCTL